MLVPPTALPILLAMAGGSAVWSAVNWWVGISFANFSRDSQPRMSLRISSDGKSRNETRGPASSPTIWSPARARGSAAVPPAAPSPTMTTSVFLSLVAMSASVGDLEDGVVGGRLVRRLHPRPDPLLDGGHGQLDSGELDQVPPDEVGVATVVGVAEHALERVLADGLEERARVRQEPRRLVALDIAQHRILLLGRELGERRAERRGRVRVE